MRKLTYIVILFCGICFAQDFRGNLLFTLEQGEEVKERYNSHKNSIPLILNGYSNEIGEIKRGAKEFFKDVEDLGPGNHRGIWNPTSTMVINGSGSNPFQPFGSGYGKARRLFNIHFAAIDAYATGNDYKAELVLKTLLSYTANPNLDFSNETVFDRSNRSYQNPVFMVAAKMNSLYDSYQLIHELVRDSPYHQANKATIHNWFGEFAEYCKGIIDSNFAYWWLGNDWRLETPKNMRSSGTDNYFAAFDNLGSGLFECSDTQINTVNNRLQRVWSYLYRYGLGFENQTYTDLHWDNFKYTIKIGFFADGTSNEMARSNSYNGATTPAANLGVDYTWEMMYGLVTDAHRHEVAVEKGFIPISERGKYFEYETPIGSDEMISNYTGYGSTSGGLKGIKSALYNLYNYYDGTFDRYNSDGNPVNGDELTLSLVTAMANTYYNDPKLRDFWRFNTDKGLPSHNKDHRSFAVKPSSFGIGIGEGAAVGGLMPYADVPNVFLKQKFTDTNTQRTDAEIVAAILAAYPLLDTDYTDDGNGGGSASSVISNGSFDDASDWILGGSSSITGGEAILSVVGGSYARIEQSEGLFTETFVDGVSYTLSGTADVSTGGRVYFQDNPSDTGGLQAAPTIINATSGPQPFSYEFTANSNSAGIYATRGLTSGDYTVVLDDLVLVRQN